MKKKSKTTGAQCTATASGGALKCALDGEHTVHSTLAKGRKAAQHATWTAGEDGGITVTTYARGKKQGEWVEAAPKAPAQDAQLARVGYCGAKFKADAPENQCVCTLAKGHEALLHENTSAGVKEQADTRPAAQRCFCGGKEGSAAPHELGTPVICRIPHHEMCMCSSGKERTHMLGAPGCEVQGRPPMLAEADAAAIAAEAADDDQDELEDEVRSDDEREFSRKMREAREAHARELEDEQTITATGGNGAQGDPASPSEDAVMKQTAGRHLSKVKVHPAADVFPMLEGEEYEALREDIRRNGVRVRPVLDAEGLLVDGRNRLRACTELGITPVFDRLPAGTDVVDFVISANLRRRHLNASQRAMFADAVANLKQGRPKETGGTSGLTQKQAAQRFGVSDRSVREARVVRESAAPEVVGAVEQGKLSVDAAAKLAKLPKDKQQAIYEREIKPKKDMVRGGKIKSLTRQEEKRAVVRKINEQRVAPMPAGLFGVIYGDYPWLFENSDQHEGSRGHMDYPGMPMPQILAHAREAAKRAGKDCIVALWFVDAFLHEIGNVLAAYGATQRKAFIWDKCTKNDKDKVGVGTWGRPRHEILIIASIGNPQHTLNEVETLIRAVVREPGRKPDVFAELLLKHCAGPHLELFAREPREGFVSWGAEVDKFATEAA